MQFFNKQQTISEGDLMGLRNKVVIVTGGNSGIGYATAQFLVRKGAKVYLATRNEAATKEAMGKLEQEGMGDGTVRWLKLDLGDPWCVKRAAEEFLDREERVDVLVNNAGKAFGPFNLTKDGLRESMAINYLGHFIFTEQLLPLLIKTSKEEGSDVRIINISSRAHFRVKPASFAGKDNFNKTYGTAFWNELRTYALSKLAKVHHIKHLQQRLDSLNLSITCMAVDPGTVMTPSVQKFLDRRWFIVRQLLAALVQFTFAPPRRGAMNPTFAAASPDVGKSREKFKGAYVMPIGNLSVASGSDQARDARLADDLYKTTVEILKDLGIECGSVIQ